MMRITSFLTIIALLLSTSAAPAQAAEHPRVFFTPERLERIQEGIERDGSHFAEAFALLKEQVDADDLDLWGKTEDNWNYARSYKAQAEAFVHVVTGEQRYADMAYETLRAVHDDPGPDERLPESGAHLLSRATVGLGFGLAYDWCYNAWNEDQRAYVLEKLELALDKWPDFSHANFGAERGSNWVSVCRGAELMMMLGAGQEQQRSDRYETLQTELRRHIEAGHDSIGATQEGIGYLGYGGIFLLPAIHAAKDVGDDKLFNAIDEQRRWYRKAMYAGSFASAPSDGRLGELKVFPASGVGGPNTNDEGWTSLLAPTVPDAELPQFTWWYDRHMGRLAEPQDDPGRHYEPRRQGRMWALLFYPDHIEAEDPTGKLEPMVTDGQGRHYFRNRWQDVNDILVAFHADADHHSRAWAQSEAGMMSLVAYDTMFFAGPRTGRDGELYTKLLVNGNAGSSSDTGRRQHMETFDRGSYVVVDGGEQYANLGADNYQRHLLVEFGSPESNTAAMAMLDRIDSRDEHTYTWNARLGELTDLAEWPIDAEVGEDQGYSTFTLTAENGGVVKGWLLSAGDAAFEIERIDEGRRLKVDKQASSAEFFVVMALDPEDTPTLEVLEQGRHGAIVRVGDKTLGFDRLNDQLHRGEAAEQLELSHDDPLPVRGLNARTVADTRVELQWFDEPRGADRLVLEQREGEEGDFRPVARLRPDESQHVVTDLDPATDHAWRLVSEAADRRSEASAVAKTTTWDRGYAVHVEDFAPRINGELPSENALGHWTKRNQDRGWQLSEAEGSPRNAVKREGRMQTAGRTRIDNHNIFYTTDFRADLSGEGAAVEADLMSQGTTRFALLLRLGDGRWVRTDGMKHIASRDQWQTERWDIIEVNEWVEADPDDFSTGDTVELEPGDFEDVQGLGIWAHWPLNERWARVDQLHLYARDLELKNR